MKRITLVLSLWIVGLLSVSCSVDDTNGTGIIEEFVDITIYPETGYSRALFVEDLYIEGSIIFRREK